MAGRPRDEDIDARVLRATLDVLAARGYRGLRIDEVAAAAGVAKTTIYRRWPTLAHLAVAAVEHSLGPREAPDTGDPVQDLVSFASTALRGLAGHGGALPAIGIDIVTGDDQALAATYRARVIDPVRATAIELLERAMSAGALDPAPAEAVVDALIGAAVYRIAVLGETATERSTDDVLELLLRALGAGDRATRDEDGGLPQ